jgi:ferredoxin
MWIGDEATDFLPSIDAARCIGCEVCVKLCPNRVLMMNGDLAMVADPEACEYAGVCQEICPTQAISLIYEIVLAPPKR